MTIDKISKVPVDVMSNDPVVRRCAIVPPTKDPITPTIILSGHEREEPLSR